MREDGKRVSVMGLLQTDGTLVTCHLGVTALHRTPREEERAVGVDTHFEEMLWK